MNKAIITLGGIVAALSLSACATPQEQAAPAPQAVTQERTATETAIITVYEIKHGDLTDDGQQKLLEAAIASCGHMDTGMTADEVVETYGDTTAGKSEVRTIVNAAVETYCPHHERASEPVDVPAPVVKKTKTKTKNDTADLTEAEQAFVRAYRSASWLDESSASTIIGTSGMVCTALKNLTEDEVHNNMQRMWGLSDWQADGNIAAASPERCAALGWS